MFVLKFPEAEQAPVLSLQSIKKKKDLRVQLPKQSGNTGLHIHLHLPSWAKMFVTNIRKIWDTTEVRSLKERSRTCSAMCYLERHLVYDKAAAVELHLSVRLANKQAELNVKRDRPKVQTRNSVYNWNKVKYILYSQYLKGHTANHLEKLFKYLGKGEIKWWRTPLIHTYGRSQHLVWHSFMHSSV